MKPTFAIIIRFSRDAANFRGVEKRHEGKNKKNKKEGERERIL